MKKLVLLAILVSSQADAEWLVKDALIKEISNTSGNVELFYIVVEGGTGICSGQQI